ncbi:DUF488 family protein [Candidatus Poriferisodalis sp.]|uniref:DUF488 domain-containing protein n=1 Tax=Candidatus Poriferisodalis sp. TaxID=3101277 RepID=UPI003D12F575
MSSAVELWTIGHSNHGPERFVELLQQHSIEAVADVRSQPYSRFSPHFRQTALRQLLAEAGLGYVFLGRELGGRPPEPMLYDDAGNVLYDLLAQTQRFVGGLRRLLDRAEKQRVTMMCSEEDPAHCHRRLLVTRALLAEQTPPTVMHIRSDGRLVPESELQRCDTNSEQQLTLFGDDGGE